MSEDNEEEPEDSADNESDFEPRTTISNGAKDFLAT